MSGRAYAYWVFQYRRTWRGSLVRSLVEPVLFLAAMGLGLGSLVNATAGGVGGVGYLQFVAPGLLAAVAMQTAVGEATYPVMGAIRWNRQYHAMLATPLRVVDVLLGHLLWIATRVVGVSAAFLLVTAAFGVLHSPWALLALPTALLVGLAFATPVIAFAALQRNDSGFALLYRFGVMPLFLFSGTFFPVDQLPASVRPLAYATPLWHGVELTRALFLGSPRLGASLGHVGFLVGLAALGLALAYRAFHRRLWQ
ncbi:MAG: ABC transporter permease [Actinomycetota bacterium]